MKMNLLKLISIIQPDLFKFLLLLINELQLISSFIPENVAEKMILKDIFWHRRKKEIEKMSFFSNIPLLERVQVLNNSFLKRFSTNSISFQRVHLNFFFFLHFESFRRDSNSKSDGQKTIDVKYWIYDFRFSSNFDWTIMSGIF